MLVFLAARLTRSQRAVASLLEPEGQALIYVFESLYNDRRLTFHFTVI